MALRLTVFENLVAGLPFDQRTFPNERAARKHFEALFKSCNFDVDLNHPAEKLPLSKQKQVEIVRNPGTERPLAYF